MSLRPDSVGPVPDETAQVARAAFFRGTPWMRLRDELGTMYQDATFAALLSTRGRPAEAPWRLALISVMQFAERLSDRRAADAVRGRSIGIMRSDCHSTIPVSIHPCSVSSALGCWRARLSSSCLTLFSPHAATGDGFMRAAVSGPIRLTSWLPFGHTTASRRLVTP